VPAGRPGTAGATTPGIRRYATGPGKRAWTSTTGAGSLPRSWHSTKRRPGNRRRPSYREPGCRRASGTSPAARTRRRLTFPVPEANSPSHRKKNPDGRQNSKPRRPGFSFARRWLFGFFPGSGPRHSDPRHPACPNAQGRPVACP
jgi:hypothetical protein